MDFPVVTGIQHKVKGRFAWILYFIFFTIFTGMEKTGEGEKRELSHLAATISGLPGPWQWSVC